MNDINIDDLTLDMSAPRPIDMNTITISSMNSNILTTNT